VPRINFQDNMLTKHVSEVNISVLWDVISPFLTKDTYIQTFSIYSMIQTLFSFSLLLLCHEISHAVGRNGQVLWKVISINLVHVFHFLLVICTYSKCNHL
jgi:hypothetical protein